MRAAELNSLSENDAETLALEPNLPAEALRNTEAEQPLGPGLSSPERSEGQMETVFVEVRQTVQQKRWALGILCIAMVAVIWAGASVLVQFIFVNESFRRPFFLTYLCNSLFAINLPIWYIALRMGYVSDVPNGLSAVLNDYVNIRGASSESREIKDVVADAEEKYPDDGESEISDGVNHTYAYHQRTRRRRNQRSVNNSNIEEDQQPNGPPPPDNGERTEVFTKVEIMKISVIICPLWFLANWSYNESLAMTSVTSSTVISNTSTLWTFLLSVCVLREGFKWLKVLGVVLCIGGNLMTTFSDSSTSNKGETALGDLVCMFSAFMYGVYTVCIRHQIPDESAVSLPLFFGFLGLINMLLLFPVVVVLHCTGVEDLSGVGFETLGLIVAKGILDNVVSDYLWALGVLLTTPTVATIGLSLTIPLAIISDLFLRAIPPTWMSLGSAALVIAGFLTINLASSGENLEDAGGDRNSHPRSSREEDPLSPVPTNAPHHSTA